MTNPLRSWQRYALGLLAIALVGYGPPGPAQGVPTPPPGLFQMPLSQIPVPEPPNLYQFVKDKAAAIRLGKALFWDVQAGSDGQVACATCHFDAGVDKRRKNTLNPGTRSNDQSFQVRGPNQTLLDSDFPFHVRQNPDLQRSAVLRDSNDVVGSQGVRKATFLATVSGSALDATRSVADPVFQDAGVNVRQVTARNAPSVINAIFNFENFWDGRAHNIFNGNNPFGPLDTSAGVWFQSGTPGSPVLVKAPVIIEAASLASQAVGPVLDSVEMSAAGRTFPDLARKLLSLTPLGKQAVHPGDSVLGPLSRAVLLPGGQLTGANGLNRSYGTMIKAAFLDSLTSTSLTAPDGSTQLEANFSLFWGLAIQLYEATLVSDQTPFDRFLGGDSTAITQLQGDGMNLFFGGTGKCNTCHAGTELTAASATANAFLTNLSNRVLDQMVAGGRDTIYDNGFNSTGLRPTTEDSGRGGNSPFTNPATGQFLPLDYASLAEIQALGQLPFPSVVLPPQLPATFPVANRGAFKVPGLRNVELTAPYFHDGSVLTLEDVVHFYVRGGNFPTVAQSPSLDSAISEIGGMQNAPDKVAAMVAFLRSLTDERVRNHSAPFDHPEILIPEGEPEVLTLIPARDATGTPASSIALTLDTLPAITNRPSLQLSGTRQTGAVIQIQVNGGATIQAATPTAASWNATVSGLVEGVNSLTATATLPNSVPVTLNATITLDSTAPTLNLDPVPTPIQGSTLTLSGTVEGGLTPLVTVSTSAVPATTTVNGILWSAQLTGLVPGINNVTVLAIDPAGNVASRTAAITVVVADGILSGGPTIATADALKALRLSLGVLPPTLNDLVHGDVMPAGAPDGIIDVADALRILRKAAGLVTF